MFHIEHPTHQERLRLLTGLPGNQEAKRSGLQRPHEAETNRGVTVLRIVPFAIVRPQAPRIAEPTAATKNTAFFTETTLALSI